VAEITQRVIEAGRMVADQAQVTIEGAGTATPHSCPDHSKVAWILSELLAPDAAMEVESNP
jgi:hypothetical protein